MTTVTDPAVAVVQRLYDAYNKQDLDGVMACWHPDGTEFLPLVGEMAPDRLCEHLKGFYAAFPDARTEVVSIFSDGEGHVCAQVQLSGTFTGGKFDGLIANGAHWSARMAEVFTVTGGLILRMDAYMDSMDLARQLNLLPPTGSPAERFMRGAFNLKTRLGRLFH
ncbi:Ketosteroid isomerase-related protein [Amycolatopsis xylanica]|uniref:Ketosteroid isomerase-related protein n=1 Tax=Amycolatopsis xylanica TaxID=589385 RepID=A0A1H3PGQ8_9PSEU|nr:nuclear transport factor 2 family protein [Amycolatopsis xylanica]SDZ00320.1 Ketosteroid isomerase-related protein [Amycolatopsis xylanica]